MTYRLRVRELEKITLGLIREIDEFPRSWKNTVLFHGIPQSENQENIYILGHAVCDVIRKTLGAFHNIELALEQNIFKYLNIRIFLIVKPKA